MEYDGNWALVSWRLRNLFGAVSNLIFNDSRLIGSNRWYEYLLTVFGDVRTLMPIDVDPLSMLHIAEAFAMHPPPRGARFDASLNFGAKPREYLFCDVFR
jgi:hypothetical protein